MLSHIPAHSFPSLSWTQGKKKKKKNCLAAFLRSLQGDPEAEPGGRERRGSDFLPPNRRRLPMKRDAVQLDLWGDVGGYPDSGTERDARCSETAEPTQITSVKLEFSDLPSNSTKPK